MTMLKHYLYRAITLPTHIVIRKAVSKFKQTAYNKYRRYQDLKKSTHSSHSPQGILYSYLPKLNVDYLLSHEKSILITAKNYLEHRFDLLGSGWVQVKYGMKCRGLERYRYDMGKPIEVDSEGKWLHDRVNMSNLITSQQILKFIAPTYMPIDWQIDFKSGYRWSEKTWYKDIKYGHKLGVDIKVPWELARMQHLPQLALAFQSLPKEAEDRFNLKREFRNQVLDFIATNPPRFGVNWACPMDVSIRAANWLMAYDLFRAGGAQFDDGFEAILIRSIYDHGLHIVKNLEWYYQERGNHYLADISGLVFIAAYLPSTSETDAWLAFAVQELIMEVEHQFYPDGGNFEGSTVYHRLSAEMVYFATALIFGLSHERREKLKRYKHKALKTGWGKFELKPVPLLFYSLPEGSRSSVKESPFPFWYFERMERMAEFIMDITKPNGHIPQIGDNDSGRFFKLSPKYAHMTVKQACETYANLEGDSELPDDADYFMEDHLDCSHIVAAAYGLFGREDFALWLGGEKNALCMPDCLAIRGFSSGTTVASHRFYQRRKEDNDFFSIGTEEDYQQALLKMQSKPKDHVRITEIPSENGDLHQDITLRSYPDFGLYIYTSPHLYLAIRCWPGHKPFHTAHMHNDQLSIELVIAGQELLTDPGTYLYTPLPKRRNEYRSAKAHNGPNVGMIETVGFNHTTLFTHINALKAHVKYVSNTVFIAENVGLGRSTWRAIQINPLAIIVTDFIPNDTQPDNIDTIDSYDLYITNLFSPAYGVLLVNTNTAQLDLGI